MLYWKNKPIEDLSTEELRLALSDSVRHVLDRNTTSDSGRIFTAFTAGAFSSLTFLGLILLFIAAL